LGKERAPQKRSIILHFCLCLGTTTYGFSPATGKVNAHIDTWDMTEQQDWFSVDEAAVIARQILESSLAPGPEDEGRFRAIR